LFQCTYEQITRLVLERKSNIAGTETEYLYILLGSEELVQLHPSDAHLVLQTIQDRMDELGLKTDESAVIPLLDETARKFLFAEEHILHTGKMSHLVAEKRPGNTVVDIWKPGHLYLTTKRLVWWYDFDGAIRFEAPLDTVVNCELKRKDLGGLLKNKLVFDILCQPEQNKHVVHSFSDDENQLAEWEKVLGMYVNGKYSEEEEECPQCGTKNPVAILLASGCPKCGWVSMRRRREEKEHAY
ncbi:MAG: hypothetical protein M0R06_27055, partial [Sphaerochaeta sp.]|nr:hypothetical protein [Sphaerochaeta sp.]